MSAPTAPVPPAERGGSTPLRVQLVAALVLLLGLAVTLTGVAATTALRGYLLDRVDGQLLTSAQRDLGGEGPRGGPRRGRGGDERHVRGPGEFLVQVTSLDGRVVSAFEEPVDRASPPRLPVLDAAEVRHRSGRPFTAQADRGDTRWRVLVVPVVTASGTSGAVTLALDLDGVDDTLRRLVLIEVVTGLATLVLAAAAGWVLVRRSLRPLVEVEHTAEAIAGGDLSRRVPAYDARTEVGRLAGALNAMLGQLEQAFRSQAASEAQARASEERMRRFVADASHELRTPLTSIRGFAELHRQGAVPAGEVPRVLRRVEDEATRMGTLVDDLLTLARLDQQRPLERAPVDLLRLATDAAHDARGLAPDREVTVELEGHEPPVVVGDEGRLRQVFANLVGNALTHTPSGTPVRVRVVSTPERALVEVADQGPGLTQDQADQVFERFYRADASRTRGAGGSGLGLSIVAALVAAHGGQVSLDTAPGRGAVFRVSLPR